MTINAACKHLNRHSDLPCTLLDNGKLNGVQGAVNRWLL